MRVKYIGNSDPLTLKNGNEYDVLEEEHGYYRIVDETGDDYLYDSDDFKIVED